MTPGERRWFLLNALPLLFLVANLAVWWVATPVGFQRFGSVGVAVAALMFGFDRVSRAKRGRSLRGTDDLMLIEIGLVVLSTLQWGYGDLFHCWTHGQGWEVCDGP